MSHRQVTLDYLNMIRAEIDKLNTVPELEPGVYIPVIEYLVLGLREMKKRAAWARDVLEE